MQNVTDSRKDVEHVEQRDNVDDIDLSLPQELVEATRTRATRSSAKRRRPDPSNDNDEHSEGETSQAPRRRKSNVCSRSREEGDDATSGIRVARPVSRASSRSTARSVSRGAEEETAEESDGNSMDYSDMPTAKITKVQNRNFRCVVRGCSRHPSNWGNMRQHVNKDHLDELRKGTQHVDEQAMTDSESTFCPICRRLFKKNFGSEPWAHGCLTQQKPPSEDEGLEQGVVEGAQDQGENEQQTQSFAEWMQATSSKLKDFLAAGLRRDTVGQQMEMRDFITQGPKRKVMEQSEISRTLRMQRNSTGYSRRLRQWRQRRQRTHRTSRMPRRRTLSASSAS